jgi:two-component system, LytTR family, response regulator
MDNIHQNQHIRVLIVDDEAEARNLLERLLLRIPGIEVIAKAPSADEALEIVVNEIPDMVFLDIHMPEKNGFQLVEYFRKYLLNTCVVFVTAHAEFAINAMKVAAFDYLLKPVLMADLKETILRFKAMKRQLTHDDTKAAEKERRLRNCKIKFNTRTGYILISPDEIMYCEADVNYTNIYFNKSDHEIVTVNLGKMEEILAPYPFYRISRSILINRSFLSKADRQKRQCILVKGGEKITLDIPPNHIRQLEKLLDNHNETFDQD